MLKQFIRSVNKTDIINRKSPRGDNFITKCLLLGGPFFQAKGLCLLYNPAIAEKRAFWQGHSLLFLKNALFGREKIMKTYADSMVDDNLSCHS